jgi:membrane-associated phospholipid phosphatase
MKTKAAGRVYPYDYVILGYCALMALLILAFGRPFGEYVDELIAYIGIFVISYLIVRYVPEQRSRFFDFIRHLYPVFLFSFFYRLTGGMMFLFFDGFYDWQLTTFEAMLMGVNPTLLIDREMLNLFTTELLSFCYFAYYLMLPAFMLALFLQRKYDVIRQSLTAICLTFFMSYLLFSLYPVEGPRWFFASDFQNSVSGPLFRPLVEFVIDNGAVRGGAMPSSHVAVALVVMWYCFKHYRLFGWILLLINIGLAAGTVWGRFHYVSDVLVGIAIAVFCVALVVSKYDTWTSIVYKKQTRRKLKAEHVT